MAPGKIRRALGAVKDQTSIGLIKVSNSTSISDLDVAIVKATRHDEHPAEEKHIREILSLTCYSRIHINQCVSTLSRRLGKTRSWTVALKTLILVHRLLTEGDPTYEQEIFFTTRRGTRMLNLSDFRDTSRSDAWDYSAFVRTYARYLDEMLEYRMHGRRTRRRSRSQQMHEDWEQQQLQEGNHKASSSSLPSSSSVHSTPVREMRTEKIFARTQHLQQLLERFLACRPTGSAKHNRITAVALFAILKESAQLYYELQEVMAIFVDRFMELEIPDCVKIYGIFSRLSKQFDELDRFYSWCKSAGISRPSELPEVERITQQKLDVMDDFIRDKSDLQSRKVKSFEQLTSEEDAMREAAEAESLLRIKALPAPEPEPAKEPPVADELPKEVKEEEPPPQTLAIVKLEEEVDFLNLRDDTVTVDDYANSLALALFDGNPPSNTSAAAPAWEAFTDGAPDWETALVESASSLSVQKPTMGGGFDVLLLDGMYRQPRQPVASGFSDGGGSASSMATSKPTAAPVPALPAPPTMGGGYGFGGDPFAASLSVPPPSYVQMTEMERKQRLLVEEQMMWQQYAKDGMQGQVAIAKLQQAGMHPMGGGYVQRF